MFILSSQCLAKLIKPRFKCIPLCAQCVALGFCRNTPRLCLAGQIFRRIKFRLKLLGAVLRMACALNNLRKVTKALYNVLRVERAVHWLGINKALFARLDNRRWLGNDAIVRSITARLTMYFSAVNEPPDNLKHLVVFSTATGARLNLAVDCL